MKLYLLYIGKARDAHVNAIAEEFIKRSERYLRCEMREIDPRRYDLWARHPSAKKVLLDPAGRNFNSGQFTELVGESERKAHDIVFVIGGADGHPEDWKSRADLLLSLSPMTYPHELARAMLAEQIYRAVTTLRGHPYPR